MCLWRKFFRISERGYENAAGRADTRIKECLWPFTGTSTVFKSLLHCNSIYATVRWNELPGKSRLNNCANSDSDAATKHFLIKNVLSLFLYY